MLMTVYRNEGRYERSNVRFSDGMVRCYEKAAADPAAAGMHHVDYGLLAVRREVVSELGAEVGDEPSDLSDLQHRLSVAGRVGRLKSDGRTSQIRP